MNLFKKAVALILGLAPVLFCQTPYGRITGRIVDSSGAVIVGAPATAIQVETNIVTKTAANSEGVYEFPALIPGNYKLIVEMPGFKRVERGPMELRVADVLSVTLTLSPGDLAETVTVTSEAPLIEASTASVSQSIAGRQITELPIGGRSITYLLQMTPGVINPQSPNVAWNPQARANISAGASAAGAGQETSEYTMDGIPNMDDGGTMMVIPPPDIIQEFRVQTAAFDASLGRFGGASVNMVMKSGNNQFHGALHYGLERRALNSNPFFVNRALHDTRTGPPTKEKRDSLFPQSKTDRYRTMFSGPVWIPKLYDGRNRTFFTYGNEFMKNMNPGAGFQTVPTAAQRQGDFSQLLSISGQYQIYDPATIASAPNGRFSRQPFAGNIIPRSRLDRVAQNLLGYYPEPNVTGTIDGRNNFSLPPQNTIDWTSHFFRVDQVINDRQRVYATIFTSHVAADQGRSYRNDGLGSYQDNPSRNLAVDYVNTLSPTTVLNLRAGMNRIETTSAPVSAGVDIGALGFSSRLQSQVPREFWALPGVSIDGYGGLNAHTFGLQARTFNYTGAHVTNLRGAHTLKIGGEWRVLQRTRNSAGRAMPQIDFSTDWTRGPLDNAAASPIGQGLASFLLGLPTGGFADRNDTSAQASHYTGFYIQDNWKVSQRLTLDYGLRYELEFPVTERFNRANRGFDFLATNPVQADALRNYASNPIPQIPVTEFRTLGGLQFAGLNGVPRGMTETQTNNFLPRVGVAYLLRPKTLLRAGYGVFFNAMGNDRIEPPQAGFSQRTSIVPSFDNGLTFSGTLADPLPGGILAPTGAAGGLTTNIGRAVSYVQPARVPSYMQRWSATVQHEFSSRTLVELGYLGNKGSRLDVDRNFNPVPAQYLSTSPARDQATINFLTQQVANPFFGLPEFTGSGLAGRNVARQQLLSPHPHFLGLNSTTNEGHSNYHQGHVRVERRMSRGIMFTAAYTWSKFMEATSLLNPADVEPHRVISSLDRPHRFITTGMWDLPWGRNKLWGGWTINGMYQWQSGAPIEFGNIIFNGNLADMVLPRSERIPERWFNTEAGFNRIAAQQLANNIRTFPLRLTGLRSHEWNVLHATLIKNFRISESVRFQLRVDGIDVLNHPIFSSPNTAPVNTLFGQVTATAGAIQRSFEIIGRLTW